MQAGEQVSYTQGNVLAPVNVDDLDPDERSCRICLQAFGSAQSGSEAPVQLPCGHILGEACIASWTLVSNSCPLCRAQVFGFGMGDNPIDQRSSVSQVSNIFSSLLSPQYDVWLNERVWNDSIRHRQDTVSSVGIETWISSNAHDHSDVDLGSQPQRSPEVPSCGEHGGFCHCGNGQNTGIAALPRLRPVAQGTDSVGELGVQNSDLAELGSQFSELDYRCVAWMDDLLNEPISGEEVESDETD